MITDKNNEEEEEENKRYRYFGFRNLNKLKEYGKHKGIIYEGNDFKEGYERIIGFNHDEHFEKREKHFKVQEKQPTEIELLEAKVLDMQNILNTIPLDRNYHFLINIGTSLKAEKITTHIIRFPPAAFFKDIRYDQIVLQVTPFLDNKYHHFSAYCTVIFFELLYNSINVYLLTGTNRSFIGWNVNLEVYLTVTILKNPITKI